MTEEEIRRKQIDDQLWRLMLQVPGWVPPTEATVMRALALGEAKIPFYTSVGTRAALGIVRVGDFADTDFWEELDFYISEFLRPALERSRARRKAAAEKANTVPANEHSATEGS